MWSEEDLERYLIEHNYFKENKQMKYILEINEQEKTLLLADLHEMVKQEEFYDKDIAENLYYKVLYAISHGEDGKHFTED
jgi:hypothetical protein